MSQTGQPTGEEVRLPIKREDGNTVEETLTDNAINNILPARYLRKDEDGNLTEEPAELFERVAKNIALAEAVYETNNQERELWLTPDMIKPDHPRRGELAAEVFGYDGRKYSTIDEVPDDLAEVEDDLLDDTVKATEKNINKFAYDTVIPELDDDITEHVEGIKKTFQTMMESLGFMPNSPTIMNAGDELQQLSACFVDSPGDDISKIHQTAKEAAEIFQSGGGMGYAFHTLRPYGDSVGSTGGIASGPITFMETYDQLCETIAQGGARRGAQMGVMKVSHPDVIQFIHAKNKDISLAHTLRLNDPDDFTHNSFAGALEEARELIENYGGIPEHLRNAAEGHLSNFNISVGVTHDFMDALKNGGEFTFTNPRTGEAHIATEETKELYEIFGLGEHVEVGEELSIPAEEIWDDMVEGAHENGEPGVIYLDQINDKHSFDVEKHPEHVINATNPCGEQPLEEYEACNLGHINLSTLASTDSPDWRVWYENHADEYETKEAAVEGFLSEAIDWDSLNHRIKYSTRFLENVVTMSDFPVDKIEETVSNMRKIGLGIMGLAQLYIQLGVKYGSEDGNEIARQLMKHINHESKQVSHELAVERGNFSEWDKSKYADPTEYQEWFEHHTGLDADEWEDGFPIRNHNTTTIAPTGTTSMIGNTTGGCEPIYNVAYYKNVSGDVQGDEMLVEFDDYFLRVLEENDIGVEAVKQEAQEQMAKNEFDGVDGLEAVPDKIGELFIVTSDLSGKEHASVQCALQEGVDSSISKTCNFPSDATKEDMDEVYRHVYEHGGKGVTVYRDGARAKQVKTTRKDNKEFADEEGEVDSEEFVEFIEEVYGSINEFLNDTQVRNEIGSEVNSITDIALLSDLDAGFATERPRPKTLRGVNTKISTGYGPVYVNINVDKNGDPFEVFCKTGQSGGLFNSFAEALGMTISKAIRSGVDPQEMADILMGIRSPKMAYDNQEKIESIPDAIGKALNRYIQGELTPEDGQQRLNEVISTPPKQTESTKSEGGVNPEDIELVNTDENTESNQEQANGTQQRDATQKLISNGESPECPECGEMRLYYSEGCKTCESCGWSEC